MTILASYIENGVDKLNQKYLLGKNLIKSVGFYMVVTFLVTIILYFMTKGVVGIAGGLA